MNFVRFSARLDRRGRSRALARSVARRRFAVFSVALAAVLASVALTTGPASASTLPGTCLDADAQQVYDGGAIIQWDCSSDDLYQQWLPQLDNGYYLLENVGALEYDDAADCLEADAGQVYDFGAILQEGCNTSDPYQQWIPINGVKGTGQLENVGALEYDNAADCLDADAGQPYDYGAIIQWGCNSSDPYQQWTVQNFTAPQNISGGDIAYQNLGTAVADGGGV